jgi:hypothetical protein
MSTFPESNELYEAGYRPALRITHRKDLNQFFGKQYTTCTLKSK